MKTLRTNAELNFRSVLSAIKLAKKNWTAQHYRLSYAGPVNDDNTLEKMVFGLITEHLAEHEGFVFYCSDGDIILLVKSASAQIYDTIANQITTMTRGSIGSQSTLIRSYALNDNWDEFCSLCEQKIAIWNEKKKDSKLTKTTHPAVSREQVDSANEKLLEIGKAERAARKRPCVMLVEDDQSSLFLAKKALDGMLSVATASSAAEARKNYLNTMPDVVFLDIGLPDGNGHDVLQDIMKLDDDAYIVMLSGNSFEEDILKAMRRGAKGFVGKPFSRAKLLQYIYQSPHCIGFATSNRVV